MWFSQRAFGRAGVAATFLVAWEFVGQVLPPPPPTRLIQVPVRSCALEGSSAAQNPDTDNILLARLRAISTIWLSNGAGISFRSALYPVPGSLDHLPKISDQCWPGGVCPGNPGDVFDSTGDFGDSSLNELKVRMWACAFSWSVEYPDAQGILLIDLQRFVAENGARTQTAGAAPYIPLRLWFQPQYCNSPRQLSADDIPFWAAVAEDPSLGDANPAAAHELGHDLLLAHGDGLDNNCNSWPSPAPNGCSSLVPPSPGPRLYDRQCDPNETDTSSSLMSEGSGSTTITRYQIETAKAAAVLVPGAIGTLGFNPFAANNAVSRTFLRAHAPSDIVSAQIAHNVQEHELRLTITLFGPIAPDPNLEYVVMVDLDGNSGTGGDTSVLNIKPRFRGAELTTRIRIKGSAEQLYPDVEVWNFNRKRFLRSADKRISARITRQNLERSKNSLFDLVSVSIPDSVARPPAKTVRIQAASTGADGEVLDRLQDESEAAKLSLGKGPALPTCVSPPYALPDQSITVSATGLVPKRPTNAFLGTELIAHTGADSGGNTKATFRIPGNYSGIHQISITSVQTGVTATCFVTIGK